MTLLAVLLAIYQLYQYSYSCHCLNFISMQTPGSQVKAWMRQKIICVTHFLSLDPLEWARLLQSMPVRKNWDSRSGSFFISLYYFETVQCRSKKEGIYPPCFFFSFKVFEVNSSSQRSGRQILSQLKEATQSHQVDIQGVNAHKPSYFSNYSSNSTTIKSGTSPSMNFLFLDDCIVCMTIRMGSQCLF